MNSEALRTTSRAFQRGQLAERVIQSLARAAARLKTEEKDRESFREAAAFLSEAIKGYDWIERPVLSEQAREQALAFEDAALSWQDKLSEEDFEFSKGMQTLLEFSEKLSQGDTVSDEAIENLRDFFGRVMRQSVTTIDSCINPAGSTARELIEN